MSGKYLVITHTDIDGVASASLYIYLQGSQPRGILFSEPYTLNNVLPRSFKYDVDRIAIMDLGMNPRVMDQIFNALEKITSRGIAVEWYDHHVWDDKWIKKLEELGVKAMIDKSICATGVVAKYAPRSRSDIDEEFIDELVKGVCAGDLWRFDHWRGPWYIRLVRRRDNHRWRLYVINIISRGILWIDEFTEVVTRRVENELREFQRLSGRYIVWSVNGVKIAVALSSDIVDNSFTASFIMGRTDADIVVIASRDGKLSLRSRRVNVREIAKRLGGGGHPRAAGAKIKIPLITRLKSIFNNNAVLEYVSRRINDVIYENGIEYIG